jgi:hypothetical protein
MKETQTQAQTHRGTFAISEEGPSRDHICPSKQKKNKHSKKNKNKNQKYEAGAP